MTPYSDPLMRFDPGDVRCGEIASAHISEALPLRANQASEFLAVPTKPSRFSGGIPPGHRAATPTETGARRWLQ